MEIETKILSPDSRGIAEAAALIKSGNVVAFPTETVYGLGADALNGDAVKKIYAAKGRPSDNPLIVHIADISHIYKYAENIPDIALRVGKAFWPGPVTMIFKKKDIIPMITSGGLDTVGLRVPANETARTFIRECGCPIAAPSANLSGSPSPTRLRHVICDMNGRIPAILDGGDCAVGVESTVIAFDEQGNICLLRPGFVSVEDIEEATGKTVALAQGVLSKVDESKRVLSPGMKYRHYAPKAKVIIVDGGLPEFAEFMNGREGCAMIFDGDERVYKGNNYIKYGSTPREQARNLFSALRRADELGYSQVYVRCPEKTGVGLAVYNRLLRAAGFEVIVL